MGFSKSQSETAIKNFITVQAALESIFYYNKNEKCEYLKDFYNYSIITYGIYLFYFIQTVTDSSSDLDDAEPIDYNENESENSENENKKSAKTNNENTKKMNFNNSSSSSTSSSSSNNNSLIIHSNKSTNNEQYDSKLANENSIINASTSLWIGNVDPSVNDETLTEIFSVYGQLANVRCLPDKYCAFVNFKVKEDAHKAMLNLQGKYLEGQRLLIKYPDNPNTVLLSSLVSKSQK
jgi:RNA recognition motif-containing protein